MESRSNLAIEERKDSIQTKGEQTQPFKCNTDSVAGCVSQRACVYCGARVVLNPITDAIHLVHGPIGCASYTWDIRGSLTSGADLFRFSFSTDLQEMDVIFGGEKKLTRAIDDLVAKYHPPLMFVYSTCIVGVIGDDLEAVCKAASKRHRIQVIPVQSSGFIGSKSAGYKAACDALMRLMEPPPGEKLEKDKTINYLGEFNLAGELWIIQNYLKRIGIELNVALTGDSSYDTLKLATKACLNIVQCAGSMIYTANQMKERFHIPYMNISFIGIEDTSESLRRIARTYQDTEMMRRTEELIQTETEAIAPKIAYYRSKLQGKKAAIYVGGGFKAISLIKQFRELGIEVVMVGTQTGREEEYETINDLVKEGTVIMDDTNPSELEKFIIEKEADLLVGGVKERPLAYKMGIAFIDHNHDRKHPLSGYAGAANFAEEVYATVCSPVWAYRERCLSTGAKEERT